MIKPAYINNYITLVVSSSNYFVPYLSVLLISLYKNSTDIYNYDIIIFENDITEINKQTLRKIVEKENISLRFYNPSIFFNNIEIGKIEKLRNINSLYRILVPELMKSYDKVIFTDSDLIFNNDLININKISLDDKILGCVVEPIWELFINNKNKTIIEYSKNILKLKNIYKYYNTGVIIFDIEKCIQNNFTQNILAMITPENFKFEWQEQCIITSLYNDKIAKIPFSWNYEVFDDDFIKNLSHETKKYILTEEKNIIHFVGKEKPWLNKNHTKYHELWWDYAKHSPYYDYLIKQLLITLEKKYINNLCKYFIYNFIQFISIGKTKEIFQTKKNKYKTKVKTFQEIKNIKITSIDKTS